MPADFPVTEFGDVLKGTAKARARPQEVTMFDSVGFALEDFSALRFLHKLQLADAANRRQIDLVPHLDDPKDLFGLLAPAAAPAARASRIPLSLKWPVDDHLVALIGAPTDIGAGSRGASMGPEALRVADIGPVLDGHGLEVLDRGNLAGPRQPVAAARRRLPAPGRGGRLEPQRCTTRCTPSWRPAACRSCSAATTAWASARSARWRATAARPARSCACCGSTRTPTSTPTRSRPAATCTACRSPACAATARRS